MPRVLLVDNDDSLRRALARTIRLAGFDVASFECAESLLAAGAIEGDVCLLLDIDTPGVGGLELHRALSASGRDLPTVFITTSERKALDAQFANLAPVAVLQKPFGTQALLDALRRACG